MNDTTERLLRDRDNAQREFVRVITTAVMHLHEEQLRLAKELSQIPGILAGFWERLTGDKCAVVAVEEAHRAYEAHAARVKNEIQELDRLISLGHEENSNGK